MTIEENGMRFTPALCPTCKVPAFARDERIPANCELNYDEESQTYAFEGDTEVCWDGQEAVVDPQGRHRLMCPQCDEMWLAYLGDEPDPEDRRPELPGPMVIEHHYQDGDLGATTAEGPEVSAIAQLWSAFCHGHPASHIILRPLQSAEPEASAPLLLTRAQRERIGEVLRNLEKQDLTQWDLAALAALVDPWHTPPCTGCKHVFDPEDASDRPCPECGDCESCCWENHGGEPHPPGGS